VLSAIVVDASAAARERVATLLKLGGWEVHHAVGTEAALRLAGYVNPGLVVTDFVMRGGNGAALLHRLRNEGCTARSVVVAAHLDDQVREHAAAAGALACLAKPVDPREFLDVLHVVCGAPLRPAQPAPARPDPLQVEAQRLDRLLQTDGTQADRRTAGHARLMELVAISVIAQARMPALTQARPSA
jgi:CheY-like chemotaxis protein